MSRAWFADVFFSFLFSYVRDCLEVLRLGAGLDNGLRLRRTNTLDLEYIYIEDDVRRLRIVDEGTTPNQNRCE